MSNALVEFRGTLQKMEPEFAKALPAQVPAKRFIRTIETAVQLNPSIVEKCDRRSIFASCMRAASDGLILDGKEAALVPFKGQATYMPMTQGIIKMVRNSGDLSTLSAYVVHENDEFDYCLGDDEKIVHKPLLRGDRGPAIGAYAIARLTDGGIMREWMTFDEIEAIRKISRSGDKGPWKAFWGEMARKTVIRRLSKRLPMSSDLDNVISSVDEFTDFEAPTTDTPAAAGMTKAEQRVADQMGDGNQGQATDAEYEEMAPADATEEDPI